MRSALFNSLCAAACCAAAASATGYAQAAPEITVPATVSASAPVSRTLLAEAAPAPLFSSSNADAAGVVEEVLPDAPAAPVIVEGEGQAANAHFATPQPIAPKYSGSILPGQGAVPLSAGDKVVFAFRDATSPYAFLSRVVSATWSQALDSQPHYGQGWGPYGQRIGASFARGTVQDLATEAVFDPIFRDDPRYYVLGRQHKFFNRVVYAATRVVITRTDSGHNTVNAPLLLGYAAAAGANMAYYPQRDRNFHDAATGYAGSLGGGVLGMEINEFINDALRIAHLRHD